MQLRGRRVVVLYLAAARSQTNSTVFVEIKPPSSFRGSSPTASSLSGWNLHSHTATAVTHCPVSDDILRCRLLCTQLDVGKGSCVWSVVTASSSALLCVSTVYCLLSAVYCLVWALYTPLPQRLSLSIQCLLLEQRSCRLLLAVLLLRLLLLP